jgi:NADH:ubiquinone oxidoreductase subunit 3 (subunit A)
VELRLFSASTSAASSSLLEAYEIVVIAVGVALGLLVVLLVAAKLVERRESTAEPIQRRPESTGRW